MSLLKGYDMSYFEDANVKSTGQALIYIFLKSHSNELFLFNKILQIDLNICYLNV